MNEEPAPEVRSPRPRSFSREEMRLVLLNQADAGLKADLDRLAGETTGDLEPR